MTQFVRPNISKMQGYVPGEQPQGGKFIKLNTNENPYPASDTVTLAIKSVLDKSLIRYPDASCTAFRIAAAEVLGVEPDWILCGNGSDDILTVLTRAMVGEGDLLRLPTPSYVLYNTLARIQNARSEEIPFDRNWQLVPEFAAATSDLKLVFLPNPNSPSGTMISKAEIVQLAKQLPCPLLIDEAYADFADFHCVDLVKEHKNILVSRTLSKGYGLAGLRFGFLIAQPQIIAQLHKVRDSYNCDALAIAGATAAISDQDWVSENRAKVIATRTRLETGMQEMGFLVTPSQANFVWSTHPDRPLKPLYQGLKTSKILTRYMDYPGWGEGLRISVGTDDQIDACLSVLQSLIQS